MDKINLNEISIQSKIKAEVERIKKFNLTLLDTNENIEIKDIDIRNYTKYVLRSGTDLEKRELLSCLQNKLLLTHKQISIAEDQN